LGFAEEVAVLCYLVFLWRKRCWSDTDKDEAAESLWDFLWCSVAMFVFCHLFAFFQYYLCYLPFALTFYMHHCILLPLTALVYPLIIWWLPYAGLPLSKMLDDLINPSEKPKLS
jgi:hypothetical protein